MTLASSIATLLAVGACQSSDVSRELGARCAGDHDCDGLCLTSEPGGFCTTACSANRDCDGDAACVGDSSTAPDGVCQFTCAADVDCAFLGADYGCRKLAAVDPVATGMVLVCDGS